MVLIGPLGEGTDVQRCLLPPPPADLGRRCLYQRDAARQTNKPGRCEVGRPQGGGGGGGCPLLHYYCCRAVLHMGMIRVYEVL